MNKQPNVGDNIKVIFTENEGIVNILIGKILKKNRKTLSLKSFKKVVYNLKKKVNIIVDLTPTIEKIKYKNTKQVSILSYNLDSSTQAWDDGEY